MKPSLLAALAAVLIVAPSTALADPTVSISIPIGAHAKPRCDVFAPVAGATIAAQIVDSAVVANAVGQGSIGKPLFGSNHAVAGYVGEQFALDGLVWLATRRASCGTKTAAAGVLGASAILNATQTEFTR